MRAKPVLTALLIFVVCVSATLGELRYLSSPITGPERETIVADEMIKSSPHWKKSSENPPVSARRALKLTNEYVAAHIIEDDEWRRDLPSLALVPVEDKWLWKVNYVWWPKHGGLGGVAPWLSVIILMDGTVVPDHPVADASD